MNSRHVMLLLVTALSPVPMLAACGSSKATTEEVTVARPVRAERVAFNSDASNTQFVGVVGARR